MYRNMDKLSEKKQLINKEIDKQTNWQTNWQKNKENTCNLKQSQFLKEKICKKTKTRIWYVKY